MKGTVKVCKKNRNLLSTIHVYYAHFNNTRVKVDNNCVYENIEQSTQTVPKAQIATTVSTTTLFLLHTANNKRTPKIVCIQSIIWKTGRHNTYKTQPYSVENKKIKATRKIVQSNTILKVWKFIKIMMIMMMMMMIMMMVVVLVMDVALQLSFI